jgi:hypothetical protein
MREVRQDSTWQARKGRPRSTPVRRSQPRKLASGVWQQTTDERRATSRRCPGPRTFCTASAVRAGRSARNTASRTTCRARPRSFGSRGRGTCSAAAPPGARRLRTRRCWDGTTALRLSGRAGPGVHPHRWDPSGNRRVGEVATESMQEAKARRGRTPPEHRRKRDREGRGGQRSWRQRRQGQDGMRGRPTTRSPLAGASEHHLGDAPGAGP